MKQLLTLPLAAALMAATAPPVSVVAATGSWSDLPPIGNYGTDHLTKNLMVKLIDLAMKRQCALPGFKGDRLDFNISFAAQFDPDGTLRKVVVPKLNCPEAEAAVGGALVEMINGGDYRPTGKSPGGWYQGQFAFDYQDGV
jgi:hypothetical protein